MNAFCVLQVCLLECVEPARQLVELVDRLAETSVSMLPMYQWPS